MTDIQHGKSAYSSGKCRCDVCRSEWASYTSRRAVQRKAWVAQFGLPSDVKHGSSAYKNWGCRCSFCRASHKSYRKRGGW